MLFLHAKMLTGVTVVHGSWGPWSLYSSSCSVTCGTGDQTRSRTCTNPAPQNGGDQCVGSATESQPCEREPCARELVDSSTFLFQISLLQSVITSNYSAIVLSSIVEVSMKKIAL